MSLLDRLEALLTRRREEQRVPRDTFHRWLLPSNQEKLYFRAHLTLRWMVPPRSTPSPQREATVLGQVAEVAKQAARSFSVLHREEAESSVNKALWEVGPLDRFFARADATLLVEPEDVEFARQQREWDLTTERLRTERQAEVARLTALRDTLLRDAPTARLWWLDSDPKRLIDLARHANDFEQAVALVSGDSHMESSLPGTETMTTAKLIELFLRDLGLEQRMHLIHQVGRVFQAHERSDLAEQLLISVNGSTSAATPNGVRANDAPPPAIP